MTKEKIPAKQQFMLKVIQSFIESGASPDLVCGSPHTIWVSDDDGDFSKATFQRSSALALSVGFGDRCIEATKILLSSSRLSKKRPLSIVYFRPQGWVNQAFWEYGSPWAYRINY